MNKIIFIFLLILILASTCTLKAQEKKEIAKFIITEASENGEDITSTLIKKIYV